MCDMLSGKFDIEGARFHTKPQESIERLVCTWRVCRYL